MFWDISGFINYVSSNLTVFIAMGSFLVAIYAASLSRRNRLDRLKDIEEEKLPHAFVTIFWEAVPDKDNTHLPGKDNMHISLKNNGKITIPIRDVGIHTIRKGQNSIKEIGIEVYRRSRLFGDKLQVKQPYISDKYLSLRIDKAIGFEPFDLKPGDIFSFDMATSEFEKTVKEQGAIRVNVTFNEKEDLVSIYFIDDEGNHYESKPRLLCELRYNFGRYHNKRDNGSAKEFHEVMRTFKR